MGKSKLVSVVIPTYSRPTYLKRAIESVLNQSYKEIEVIVVDDNDPNTQHRRDTEKIMQLYSDDTRITYIKHPCNRNGSAARNSGWKAAKGDYITFLDDDDELLPEKIKRQVECLESKDESWGMCYTAYKLIKESGQDQVSSVSKRGDCYVDALMRTFYLGSGSNLFLRKEVVDKVNGYDESFSRNQDVEFLVRVSKKHKIEYIDECLLVIHQEGERKSRSYKEMDIVTRQYMGKFKTDIDSLERKDRERVIAVISLDHFRYALYKRKIFQGIGFLIENRVKPKYLLKYFKYLVHRVVTHESYGFDGI